MNSEKVKEIKKDIEICMKSLNCNGCSYKSSSSGECCRNLTNDILTYINELESENDTLHTNLCEWRKENQQLKDRIAELEKEIEENAFYSKGYAQGIKNTYEVVLPDKLKQFAERLKEKPHIKKMVNKGWIVSYVGIGNDIDET